jgi:lipopolysaccharide export LptBFGC system permease protein LptF
MIDYIINGKSVIDFILFCFLPALIFAAVTVYMMNRNKSKQGNQ